MAWKHGNTIREMISLTDKESLCIRLSIYFVSACEETANYLVIWCLGMTPIKKFDYNKL
jgi:hypothetical protein